MRPSHRFQQLVSEHPAAASSGFERCLCFFQLTLWLYMGVCVVGILHSFSLFISVLSQNADFEQFCEHNLKNETEQCSLQSTLNVFSFCFFVLDINTRMSAAVLALLGINAARERKKGPVLKARKFFLLQSLLEVGSFGGEVMLHLMFYFTMEIHMLDYTAQSAYSKQGYSYGTPHSRIEYLYERNGVGVMLLVGGVEIAFYLYLWTIIAKLVATLPPSKSGKAQAVEEVNESSEQERRREWVSEVEMNRL